MSNFRERRENKLSENVSEAANSTIGYLICTGLIMLVTCIGVKWDGHLYDRRDCVKLQEISGAVYKIDTCTGKTELLITEQDKRGCSNSVSAK